MNKNEYIYIIVYRGRDCDTEIWDDWPMLDYGAFKNKQAAARIVEELTLRSEFEYDEEADDTPCYYVKYIPIK